MHIVMLRCEFVHRIFNKSTKLKAFGIDFQLVHIGKRMQKQVICKL